MRIGTLVVITLLVAVQGRASAQAQGVADAAIETYPLTMPNIRKMAGAYERLDAALAANPALARRLESDDAAKSAADVIARLDREPVVREAIVGAGITTRDLVFTQFALLIAGMTDFAVQAGAKSPTAPVAVANLKLYQQNRAELGQISARLKQLASWQSLQAGDRSQDADQD
jgi:hypothetical protein